MTAAADDRRDRPCEHLFVHRTANGWECGHCDARFLLAAANALAALREKVNDEMSVLATALGPSALGTDIRVERVRARLLALIDGADAEGSREP